MLKSKGKTCIVKEPSHVKQLFKIGLNIPWEFFAGQWAASG
jgi:hypothetical protein